MDDVTAGQPLSDTRSKGFLYVPVVGVCVIVAALALGFLDVIPMSLMIAAIMLATTAMTAVAFSHERLPASWTRTHENAGADEDERQH